jgi:alpha-glucosidase
MRAVLAEYGDDRLLIGELYLPIDRLVRYYAEGGSGVHLPFNFHLISTPWETGAITCLVETYEAALPRGGWPTWVLGNHDRGRVASRVGRAQARVAAVLLLTLRGTPTLYYGDEIGMTDVPIPPDRVQDPWEKNVPGIGVGRDPVRTPMQWDAGPNAGFTTGTPWLPVSEDYTTTNVEAQRDDPRSILTLVRHLLQIRREHPALALGSYSRLETGDAPVVAYLREHEDHRVLVALNLGDRDERLDLPTDTAGTDLLCSTDPERHSPGESNVLKLEPNEGVVLALHSTIPDD